MSFIRHMLRPGTGQYRHAGRAIAIGLLFAAAVHSVAGATSPAPFSASAPSSSVEPDGAAHASIGASDHAHGPGGHSAAPNSDHAHDTGSDHAHAAAPLGAETAADDERKILMLRVYFNNAPAVSRYTKAEVEAHMDSMNTLWEQTSYGAVGMDFAVSALYQVPGDDTDYVIWEDSKSTGEQVEQMLLDAVAAAPAGTDFSDLDGLVVLMADTDPDHWHRGRAGKFTLPIGEDGAGVSIKSAIFLENAADPDDKVWGRWMHEIGHVFQVAGPSHPSSYNNEFELMDAAYPGHTGVFEKLPTQGFPGWLPESKYLSFTPNATVGPAGAGVGGGLGSVWATQYDPDGKPNPQAIRAFVTDSVYYLVSQRRRVLGDDINSSFSPPGIPDEGVLIERVVEGGDPNQGNQWVTVQPPPGEARTSLWQCGQTYTNEADGVEIAIGREVVRELVVKATADSWIREGDNTSHGSDTNLYAGNFSSPEGGFDGKFRSLVRFDLSALPAGAAIESATLEMRSQDVVGSQTVNVVLRSLNSAWDEGTVTWANQPSSDFMQNGVQPVGTESGLVEWDVALQVQSWLQGAHNHGVLVKAVSEGANVIPRKFYSREYLALGQGGANSFHPTLRIVYTQTCPPEDDDPDQSYVRVSYDPGASQPDVHISPWRSAPLDAWESTDLWVDSPVNGFGTYRAGTWTTPWGDDVPYWNGDEPTVGSANRIVARIRNVGTQNATNVVVHMDITDPPGLGISGADGFKNLGTVDSGDFAGLALIPPGGFTDVWVTYEPDIELSEQEIEDGFFAFHTCFRVRVEQVAGETILGNQDGEEEQENVFWYEVPVDDGDGGGVPPGPFNGSIHLRNPDQTEAREYDLYYDEDLADGWQAAVNQGDQVVTLGPAAEMDVPVRIDPPVPAPAIASTARIDVAASYQSILTNDLLTGPHSEHLENTDEGGVSVVGGVVADTDTFCTVERSNGNLQISGTVSAARGEPLRGAKVFVRGSEPGHTALAELSPGGEFSAVLEDPAGRQEHVDCLFGGTRRLGRSADAGVPVPGAGGRPTPSATPPVVIGIAPERATLGVGTRMDATVAFSALPAVQPLGIVLQLTFNPAVLEVMDADEKTPGVQSVPGTALQGYDVVRNAADNAAGTIELEATRSGSSRPSGRDVLTISFTGLESGSSPLAIAKAELSTGRGELDTVLRDAHFTVSDAPDRLPFRLEGRVLLPGRRTAEGTQVCAPAGCAVADDSGRYLLAGVWVGDTIAASHEGYLGADWVVRDPPPQVGGPLAWPDVTLRPGDVDGDHVVGLSDAVGVLGASGSNHFGGRFLAARDLTRDNAIDGADVALVVANWGARADSPKEPVLALAAGVAAASGTGELHALPANGPRTWLGGVTSRARRADDGAVAFGLMPGYPARPASAGPLLSIEPALMSVSAGDLVTVELSVDDIAALYGAEVRLGYDPAILAVRDGDPESPGTQVSFGELLPAHSRTALMNTVDAVGGQIHVAAALTGEVPGVDGDGVLARVVFEALAPGGSDVRVLGAELRDDAYPDSSPIAVNVQNGVIDVRPAPADGPPDVPVPTAMPSVTAVATEPGGSPVEPTATPEVTLTAPATRPLPGPSATPPNGPTGFRVWLPWAARP